MCMKRGGPPVYVQLLESGPCLFGFVGIRVIRGIPGLVPLHQAVVNLVVELLEVQPATRRSDPPHGSSAAPSQACGAPPFHTKHIHSRIPPGRLEKQLHWRFLCYLWFLFQAYS